MLVITATAVTDNADVFMRTRVLQGGRSNANSSGGRHEQVAMARLLINIRMRIAARLDGMIM